MSTDVSADPGRTLRPGLLAAVAIGGSAGLFHLVRSYEPNSQVAVATMAIGQLGLYAAPFFLGVLAALARPQRPYRTALGLSALCLVAAAPLMGEGLVCLIFIAPVHLIVSPLAALVTIAVRERRRTVAVAPRVETLLLLVPLAMALAQHGDPPPPADVEVIADSVEFDATPDEVWHSIEWLRLRLDGPVPWLVRLGLPVPEQILGGGATVGAERRVVFSNGVILARVTESVPGRSFRVALSVERSGREFFDHWVALGDSTFDFEPLPGGRTRLTHATSYRPLAYPRWYFGPVERGLGRVLQRELLESYAAQFPVTPLVAER